jgi:hypothetical protein
MEQKRRLRVFLIRGLRGEQPWRHVTLTLLFGFSKRLEDVRHV